jgi:hypothetical protein
MRLSEPAEARCYQNQMYDEERTLYIMPVFSRFMIFASFVLPTTALCFFVSYLAIVKGILKNPFRKFNLLLSFFMAWFISSIPGFLYGENAYDGIYLILWPSVGTLISLFVFFCASRGVKTEAANKANSADAKQPRG